MRLIDADALKEYIDMQKGRPFIGCTIGEALKMMTDEQPTIEERTGRWEMVSQHRNPPTYIFRCSECGDLSFGMHKFCGGCGARMEGVDHE